MRVVQVVGWSNSGKTTLVEKLTAHFRAQGIETATVKHHGKADSLGQNPVQGDTGRHEKAGAVSTMLTSTNEQQWNIGKPLPLTAIVQMHALLGIDLLIIEGYKHEKYPKIVMETAERPLGNCLHVLASVKLAEAKQPKTIQTLGEIIWKESEIIL